MEKKLVEYMKWLMKETIAGGYDIDSDNMQTKAIELGLVIKTTYNPIIHGGNDSGADEGDEWYVFSPEFQALIERSERDILEAGRPESFR